MRRIKFLTWCRVMALALVCVGAIRNSKGEDVLTLNFYSLTHGTLPREVATTNWVDFVIQSTWPGAQFFYTIDGTLPSSNSTRYTFTGKPLRITNSLTFRAVAYNPTNTESNTRTLEFNVIEGNRDSITFMEHRHQFTGVEVVNVVMTSKFFPHRVFYTFDGSEPTTNSATLSGYFTYVELKTNVTVRVKAWNEDLSESVTGEWNVQLQSAFTVGIDTRKLADPTLVTRNPSYDNYVSNTVVTVTATNKNGWTFKGWAAGEGEETIFDRNPTLTGVVTTNVILNPIFKTRIMTNVVGRGRIVSPYEAQFRETVRLEAIPDEGYYFAGWTGALKGNTNETTTFQVSSGAPEITALFAPVGEQLGTLVVHTEAGQIRVTPQRDFYAAGEEVELELDLAELPSPVPTTNGPFGPKRFVGWSGDASGTENPLRVVMDGSKVIEAIVEPAYSMDHWIVSPRSSRIPAVADDGTVYVNSDALYALTPDLKVKWSVTNLWFGGEATIGPSGNVYVVAENGNAMCVSPSGQELWRYVSDDPYIYGSMIISDWPRTPTITSDETLYYLSGRSPLRGELRQLYIVKDGKLVRRIDDPPSRLLADPDDTFYVARETGFEAHKPFGTVKWSSPYPLPVAIDANGRLYSVDAGAAIVALDFQGAHLWTREVSARLSGLRIGGGGRLFASHGNGVSVFDRNGVMLWERAEGNVLPLEDGGALSLGWRTAGGFDVLQGPGTDYWMIFRRILPDGRRGEFSTYYLGFGRPNRPLSGAQTVVTDSGDVYGFWISGFSFPGSNSTEALFHWKAGFLPEGEPQVMLVKGQSGWILRKRGIPGRVAVESSTNLRDWEKMGEVDTELSIQAGTGTQLFYRLRTE